ncbi:hypothetical protein GWJ21_04165 [Bacillus coagulans]|uniref:hypothetical protein n=1 Tax=Heyndrickxia coagulans TaxID=1398 RepID=UPI001378A90A|nr:hypothetical protein [Heyndrickxia coagulans]NCG67161.1 hypothetical protein [Heyndrickxia coagulans]
MHINIKKQCKEALKKWEDEYWFVGIRFEDKEREIGEICECSKHNLDREDEREFPEYGTPEYDELPELDGTSAWNLETYRDFEGPFVTWHCYIVGGNQIANQDDGLDDNEIVIKNAVVLEKIF